MGREVITFLPEVIQIVNMEDYPEPIKWLPSSFVAFWLRLGGLGFQAPACHLATPSNA
jgi:hypothetical protein